MFLSLLLIFIQYSFQYETVTCGLNKTIYLDKTNGSDPNIIFIESPEFPKSMNENEIRNCQLNFLAKNMDVESLLFFVITSGNLQNIETIFNQFLFVSEGEMLYSYTNVPNLPMQYTNNLWTSWDAFQGYVLYEPYATCPFTLNPFTFKDESQVIYLRSHYNLDPQKINCNWKFTGPKGYGFKFVNKVSPDKIEISATNSSGYDIIKGYGLIEDQVYYNSDNYLNIKMSGENIFHGYVTVVKNQWEEIDNNDTGCELKWDGTTAIWTNIKNVAYPNNLKCNTTIPVTRDSFVVLTKSIYEAEKYIDYIELIDCYDNKHYINHIIPESWPWYSNPAFFANSEKEESVLSLTFDSDGSLQDGGFEIIFEAFECTCTYDTIIVPCDGEHSYSILNQTKWYICPYTICNVTVLVNPSCSSKHLALIFHQQVLLEESAFGFKIFSETNEIYLDSTDFSSLVHKILSIPIAPKNIISFFATKNNSFAISTLFEFNLKVIDVLAPTILTSYVLSDSKTSLKIDLLNLPKNSIFTVELTKEMILKNDLLDMFSAQFNDLSCFLLYEDKSLKRIKNSLMELYEAEYHIFSNSSISIYKSIHCEDIKMPVFYRSRMENTKHCIFNQNIFNTIPLNSKLTAISKPTGFCEIVLLNPQSCKIIEIWTTSKNESVSLFSGAINQSELILKFNENDAKLWKDMILGAAFYNFIIPPNSSISIVIEDTKLYSTKFNGIPMKSFLDTFNYGAKISNDKSNHNEAFSFPEIESNLMQTYEISNHPVIFRTESFDLSPQATLYFVEASNKTTRFEKVNQEIILQNTTVEFIYSEPNGGFIGARISIFGAKNN